VSALKNKFSTIAPGRENITLLAVSPDHNDHASLKDILEAEHWVVRAAGSCSEGFRALLDSKAAVVVCERDLPDGSWRNLFDRVRSLAHPPPVIVVSCHADESLWAEVLNLGGYDVLAKPFERSEVSRVMRMASRYGRGATHRRLMSVS
jgi:DNA-binding response OmpR family regulator